MKKNMITAIFGLLALSSISYADTPTSNLDAENSAFVNITTEAFSAASSQFKCEADYKATRTRHFIPQFKFGHYIAYGPDCGACFAAGREDSTVAGGWRIVHESNQSCVPSN